MSNQLIFVSYSSKDRPFALGLTKELEKLGAKVWIDQLGIELGENWDNAIEEALNSADTLLLLISPTSVASENVKDEVSIAIGENKNLVPVMIIPCEDLPMRWKRKQYADLVNQPDKGIKDILNFLGLEEQAAGKLKRLLDLIGISKAPEKKASEDSETEEPAGEDEGDLIDLLVSDAEIDQAVQMHKKGINRNKQLILMVGAFSLLFIAGMFLLDLTVSPLLIVIGGILINLLSVRPFGAIRRRQRNIDLMGLLKLRRERFKRVVNKLNEEEVEKFNEDFLNYISISN